MMRARQFCVCVGFWLLAGMVSGRAGPPLPVTIALPVSAINYAAIYFAEDQGLFAKENLAEHSVVVAGMGATSAVIAGSAEFATISSDAFVTARARGQPLVALAVLEDRPFIELVLRKDRAPRFDDKAPLARRARVLKDRTIGIVVVGGVMELWVRRIAREGGLDPGEIRLGVMQPPSMMAAFQSGAIDGFVTAPPVTTQALAGGAAVRVASGIEGEPPEMMPYAFVTLVARDDTCETRRPLCAGVTRALAGAAAVIRDRPGAALAVIAKRFAAMDRALLPDAFAAFRKTVPERLAVTRQEIANAKSFAREGGIIRPDDKLDPFEKLVTDEFLAPSEPPSSDMSHAGTR